MSEYSKAKKRPLSFKGVSKSEKERRADAKKRQIKDDEVCLISPELIEESKAHAGWWIVNCYENVPSTRVCLQHESGAYLVCLENGDISLGELHEPEEPGPIKEEIFTIIPVVDRKYALKTCFDRFISANARGIVYSRSEAISPQESLELVINDGHVAFQSHHKYFLGCSHGTVSATSPVADSPCEIFTLRTNKPYKYRRELQETDVSDLSLCELNLVKRYQSFANQRVLVTKESKDDLYKAKTGGNLCEEMLDRRCRVKSDRRCK